MTAAFLYDEAVGSLKVRVTPGARRKGILRWQGDVLLLKVTAPPEKGKANEACLRLIAETLGIPLRSVRLDRGATSRDKLLQVDGLSDEEIHGRLG